MHYECIDLEGHAKYGYAAPSVLQGIKKKTNNSRLVTIVVKTYTTFVRTFSCVSAQNYNINVHVFTTTDTELLRAGILEIGN